jgi:replicative DNA helicase
MDNSQNGSRKIAQRIGKTTPLAQDFGRIPPQAVDLEQTVLGAMMLEKNAVTDAIDILLKESFYDPKHQFIFGAIKELFGKSKPIDLLNGYGPIKEEW